MTRRPVTVEHDDQIPSQTKPKMPNHPLPEDELGGGDICSPEPSPATEDDAPLP